jgi:hypothetical protein
MHSVRFTKDKIPQAPFFKGDLYLLWILGSPNSELNYMFIPQHITGNSYHKTATCGGNHATSSAGGIDSDTTIKASRLTVGNSVTLKVAASPDVIHVGSLSLDPSESPTMM